jgi:hypothetical protein
VGFYVEPLSINHKLTKGGTWDGKEPAPQLATCNMRKHLTFDDVKNNPMKVTTGNLIFTYDVLGNITIQRT